MVIGYGGVQIWYGLKAYPFGRRLPKTRSPTDQNFANGLSLSTHREINVPTNQNQNKD